MIDLVAFGIIIDDLVFPDGRTDLGVLGGGGPQAAFGMRLPALAGWGDPLEVGLVAGVGQDLPESAREWFESAGIDLAGVSVSDLPTPRAWQVMEADGRRTQVWRVPGNVIGVQLIKSLDHLPPTYRGARGFHLGVHPESPELKFIEQLRRVLPLLPPAPSLSQPFAGSAQDKPWEREGEREAQGGGRGPLLSLEPFKPAESVLSDDALRALCSAAEIFSPNLAEARSLVGDGAPFGAPDELIKRLHDAGARVVALRMGAQGSLVSDGASLVHVPALPAAVVDPTGAGNAYCGGFLAGYLQTGDALTAARYGTVAASFLVEQVGLPRIHDRLRDVANQRLVTLTDDE